MGKLSSYPSPVNPSPAHIRCEIESRAQCPWCGSEMYLDRSGDRLLCADSVHCAGVMNAVPEPLPKALKEVA